MINYLRAKSCETALALPATSPEFESEETQRDFIRMVRYTVLELSCVTFEVADLSSHITGGVFRHDARYFPDMSRNVSGSAGDGTNVKLPSRS